MNIPETDIEEIFSATKNEYFLNKTILILGGSGFLGTMFKQYFLYLNSRGSGCKIISVDNYVGRPKPVEIQAPNLIHIEHDLTIPLGLRLHGHKIDYIINCSGNASPASYERFPLETMDISYSGTKHLLELALNHGAEIVNFSSSEVVGTPDEKDIPTSEEVLPKIHSLNKRAPYDVTKVAIETLCWVFKEKYGVKVKVIRPFNVVGYFRQDDFRVMPCFIDKMLKNQKLPVFAPGTQTRTFCFYTDFLIGVLKVLTEGTSLLYNVGNSDNEISMIDFARLVEKICGKTGLVHIVETPEVYLHEPKRRCPSVEKIKAELGYSPKVNLEEAIRRIYLWAKSNYVY
jgi:UDP-glucuronate decarboxylase